MGKIKTVLFLADQSDRVPYLLAPCLEDRGLNVIIETSLSTLSLSVSLDNNIMVTNLSHKEDQITKHNTCLVFNRLNPYSNVSHSTFLQCEYGAAMWATLGTLDVPVLNRPSELGLFPGTDISYLIEMFASAGWELSSLLDNYGPNRVKTSEVREASNSYCADELEGSISFFIVGHRIVSLYGELPGLKNQMEQIHNLRDKLAKVGISFLLITINLNYQKPRLLSLSPWPPSDFVELVAYDLACAIVEEFS